MKTKLLKLLVIVGFVSVNCAWTSQVLANKNRISQRQIILREDPSLPGNYLNPPVPIPISLAPGYGVNISFKGLQQFIEYVSLDNPAFATYEVIGSEETPGSIIHLRRIDPIKIEGLPNTQKTELTIVTRDQSGQQHIYIFEVSRAASPTVVLISFYRQIIEAKNACGTTELDAEIATKRNSHITSSLKRGMALAQAQGFLQVNSPLIPRVNNFIELMNCGMSIRQASSGAGVSKELVDKLLKMGKVSPTNSQSTEISTLDKEKESTDEQ